MGDRVETLFISCGEASGDQYAGSLIRSLRGAGFTGRIWGMIGPDSLGSGAEAAWSMDELRLMGVSEVLASVPRLLRLKKGITERVLVENPVAVVVVDSPDFHLPLISGLRKNGYTGKIIYLCPPTVWAWRSSRTKKLRSFCNLCLPLFGFEHDYLLRYDVPSRWVGHPLKDQLDGFTPDENLAKRLEGKQVVGLLPGSRPEEIKRLLPPLIETGRILREKGFYPLVSLAPFLPEDTRSFVMEQAGDFDIFEGPGKHVLALSSAAAGSSGTVAVESLLLGTFMVVLYKASFSSWLAYKLFVKTRRISTPNIMAEEEIFPELLQKKAKTENILSCLDRFFEDGRYRERIEILMEKVRKELGAKGAIKDWAESVMEVIGR